jgi:hypothetical protein
VVKKRSRAVLIERCRLIVSHRSSRRVAVAFWPLRHAGTTREVTAVGTRAAGAREQGCELPVLRRPGGRCCG